MQKITTTQELTKTTISKLTHFPLLFSLLPRVSTTLDSVLFTWLCNVSPTHVIKVLCRLWFNTVLICRVCQPESTSKHKRNKPPRKRKTGKERTVGKGSTQFRSWKAERGRCHRLSRVGGCTTGNLPARGGGHGSKETCCGRLGIRGTGLWGTGVRQGLETGQWSPSLQNE